MKLIQEHVNNNPIMLYMKGNPSMPMCKKVWCSIFFLSLFLFIKICSRSDLTK
jgi:glutaredoxin-related protein